MVLSFLCPKMKNQDSCRRWALDRGHHRKYSLSHFSHKPHSTLKNWEKSQEARYPTPISLDFLLFFLLDSELVG
jgi:hypothetical protein